MDPCAEPTAPERPVHRVIYGNPPAASPPECEPDLTGRSRAALKRTHDPGNPPGRRCTAQPDDHRPRDNLDPCTLRLRQIGWRSRRRIAQHQRRELRLLPQRRKDQPAILRQTPPCRQMVRSQIVMPRNAVHARPRQKGFSHNPRLHCIRPPTPSRSRYLPFKPGEKLSRIIHGETHLLQSRRSQVANLSRQQKVIARQRLRSSMMAASTSTQTSLKTPSAARP